MEDHKVVHVTAVNFGLGRHVRCPTGHLFARVENRRWTGLVWGELVKDLQKVDRNVARVGQDDVVDDRGTCIEGRSVRILHRMQSGYGRHVGDRRSWLRELCATRIGDGHGCRVSDRPGDQIFSRDRVVRHTVGHLAGNQLGAVTNRHSRLGVRHVGDVDGHVAGVRHGDRVLDKLADFEETVVVTILGFAYLQDREVWLGLQREVGCPLTAHGVSRRGGSRDGRRVAQRARVDLSLGRGMGCGTDHLLARGQDICRTRLVRSERVIDADPGDLDVADVRHNDRVFNRGARVERGGTCGFDHSQSWHGRYFGHGKVARPDDIQRRILTGSNGAVRHRAEKDVRLDNGVPGRTTRGKSWQQPGLCTYDRINQRVRNSNVGKGDVAAVGHRKAVVDELPCFDDSVTIDVVGRTGFHNVDRRFFRAGKGVGTTGGLVAPVRIGTRCSSRVVDRACVYFVLCRDVRRRADHLLPAGKRVFWTGFVQGSWVIELDTGDR